MAGETDLRVLLATLEPRLRPGAFVFVVVDDEAALPEGVRPLARVVEDEGVTLVVARDDADRASLAYDFVAAWITLHVRSALTAVGLTAAVSAALAEASIACNVLAGAHHDHLLVPLDRADDALRALRRLR